MNTERVSRTPSYTYLYNIIRTRYHTLRVVWEYGNPANAELASVDSESTANLADSLLRDQLMDNFQLGIQGITTTRSARVRRASLGEWYRFLRHACSSNTLHVPKDGCLVYIVRYIGDSFVRTTWPSLEDIIDRTNGIVLHRSSPLQSWNNITDYLMEMKEDSGYDISSESYADVTYDMRRGLPIPEAPTRVLINERLGAITRTQYNDTPFGRMWTEAVVDDSKPTRDEEPKDKEQFNEILNELRKNLTSPLNLISDISLEFDDGGNLVVESKQYKIKVIHSRPNQALRIARIGINNILMGEHGEYVEGF